MSSEAVKRDEWKITPLTDPIDISPPARVWTSDEMTKIRRGLMPSSMDDKWFIFMEGNRLFLHRSWTGAGIYEAEFSGCEGGYVLSSASVTGDNQVYRHSPVDSEQSRLEGFISSLMLDEGWERPHDSPSGPFVSVTLGDITLQDVDAIVNAANSSLQGGGGVDGAIHRAAGRDLANHCRDLGGCKTGEAKLSPGFNLRAPWVIHTVGPVWRGGIHGEGKQLASCYRESLNLAIQHDLESIAFPSISTGIYSYPLAAAAAIAVSTVTSFRSKPPLNVTFVAFDDETYSEYRRILELPI